MAPRSQLIMNNHVTILSVIVERTLASWTCSCCKCAAKLCNILFYEHARTTLEKSPASQRLPLRPDSLNVEITVRVLDPDGLHVVSDCTHSK